MNSTTYISNLKSSAQRIQFYAYYWGKFELIEIQEKDGYSFFAAATSNALNFRLSIYDEKVYLHETNVEPLLITETVEILFENPKEYGKNILYDNRPSLEGLYAKSQMYKTGFKDPEDFEDVEAYETLITGIDKHFEKLLDIHSIKGEEAGNIKMITLTTSQDQHHIKIQKELFDMEALHGLNLILQHKENQDKSLHLTIDPSMYMVILLLNEQELIYANRIGLIV